MKDINLYLTLQQWFCGIALFATFLRITAFKYPAEREPYTFGSDFISVIITIFFIIWQSMLFQ